MKSTLAPRVVRVRPGGSKLEAQTRAAQQAKAAGAAVEVREMNNTLIAIVCQNGRVYQAGRRIPMICECCEVVLTQEGVK